MVRFWHEADVLRRIAWITSVVDDPEIRQPLGYAMVGGLLVSQALTLLTTPVVLPPPHGILCFKSALGLEE
jgi:hypothetical protein